MRAATRGSSAKSSRSEEHTSELQSLRTTSYAVFCLKKKKTGPDKPLAELSQLLMPAHHDVLATDIGFGFLSQSLSSFFFNGPATSEIYTVRNTLSLHDALPICRRGGSGRSTASDRPPGRASRRPDGPRSEEHTSELQSLRTISYAVFCLKKKKKKKRKNLKKTKQKHTKNK